MTLQRKLAAVLAADVVGYTRLMELDEEQTHARLMRLLFTILQPTIAKYRGHVVKSTGDGLLAMFNTAYDATTCALELQRAVAEAEAEQPIDRRITFRIGANLADVIIEESDIYGVGVNVAARLQNYAEPGGIVVSGSVAEQISGDYGVGAIDLGDLHLRNLARPVRVFALRVQPAPPPPLIGDALAGSEPRPSIAVLPFRKYQSDPEESYFAEGIVDNIIHVLAALKELFVVSRGSTRGYGGSMIDVRSIGQELGVRYVLYGSVQRSGGRLRIATELSDAETGDIIRADQYDGSLDDLFEMQDRISVDVAKTIAPRVRNRELTRALRKHPQNMTAYDFVLQALDHLFRMDYDSFARARGLLQQAICHDPGYAPAYYYTAYWYVFRVGEMGSSDFDGDAAAGAHYASLALERDDTDALSLALFGHVQSFLLRDYDKAIKYLDRAIAAGPSQAMAWAMSSATYGYVGAGKTAVQHGERAVRLAPLDALAFWHEGILANAHYIIGDYEQAAAWARSAIGRNESIRFTSRTLIASLAALGKAAEAAEIARRFMRLQPDFRLGTYAARCPFQPPHLDTWINRLRSAGLPD